MFEKYLTAEHLVGDWLDEDGDSITISAAGDTFDVAFMSPYGPFDRPPDGSDYEVFDVSEVEWADGVLSFQVRVPSTGYELSLTSTHQTESGQLVFAWRSKSSRGKVKSGLSTLTRR